VDRSQHQQSIGLRSSQSLSCWLEIVGNVFGFASGGARVAAGSSAAMGLVGEMALKSVTAGSFVVSAVRVTNGLRNKIRKLLTRRKFARRLTDIYNSEKHQSQKEKSHEKMWGIVKDFMTVDVLRKKYRIYGIPNDHFFQVVFKTFKVKKKYEFTLLNLQTANTSAQVAAQISFDMNRNRCIPFDNMLGRDCNGMQSEE
jgi:hypothetical protein